MSRISLHQRLFLNHRAVAENTTESLQIGAGIWAILTLLIQGNACHSETEIVDMPQVYLLFATDAKGQTLYKHVQANP